MPIEEAYNLHVTCDVEGCSRGWVIGEEINQHGKGKKEVRDRMREKGWQLDFDRRKAMCPQCFKEKVAKAIENTFGNR